MLKPGTPGISLKSSMWVARTQVLKSSPGACQVAHEEEAKLEEEELVLE